MDNSMKSDARAKKFREAGNQLFAQKKYFESLVMYNKSLAHATSKLQKSLAYANRSSVFMITKMLPQCLNNIRLAREHGYPAEKRETLKIREEKCLKLMKDENQDAIRSEFFKLSYEPNPNIPFIISGLELKPDLKHEQGIFTNRDLKVGDIISMEKPFASAACFDDKKPDDNYKCCRNCCRSELLDLIPCDDDSSSMFCSEDCKKSVKMSFNFKDGHSKPTHAIGFSSFLLVGANFTMLDRVFENCQKNPETVFDYDWSDPNDPDFAEKQMKVAFSLPRTSFEGEKIWRILTQDFGKEFIDPEQKFRHPLRKYSDVAFKILEFEDDFIKTHGRPHLKVFENHLSEIYPKKICFPLFAPLINHSCNPNVRCFRVDGKYCLYVIRPIAAGQQIFYCRGIPYFRARQDEIRREVLAAQKIVCTCVVCKRRGAVKVDRSKENIDPLDQAFKEYGRMNPKEMPRKQIADNARKLAALMQKHGKAFNTREYTSVLLLHEKLINELSESEGFNQKM